MNNVLTLSVLEGGLTRTILQQLQKVSNVQEQ